MHYDYHGAEQRRGRLLRILTSVLVTMGLAAGSAYAGMSGTYTIGSSGSYSSVQSAISALNSNGVSGPVVFEIDGGSYSIPSGGFDLYSVSGMSSTNTVTFRPAAGADVTFSGSLSYDAVFTINGGSYYIIDGNSSSSGTPTRNMLIRNTSTSYCQAIRLKHNASYNTVRNCKLQSVGYYYLSSSSGAGVVMIGGYGYSYGNCDHNLIENNQIGDPNGSYRSNYGVVIYGGYGYQSDYNEIRNNDIVNWGRGSQYYYSAYAVYMSYARNNTVANNEIHMTSSAPNGYLYAIYIDDYGSYTSDEIIDGNNIHDFRSSGSYGTFYGIYVYRYYQRSGHDQTIRNNMVSLARSTNYYYYLLYQYSYGASGSITYENNSLYAGGSSSAGTYMLYGYYARHVDMYNNIFQSKRGGRNYGVYAYSPSDFNSDNNVYDYPSGRDDYFGRYGNSYLRSINAWRSRSGQDANSKSGDPRFISPSSGNLHISTMLPTPVESAGTPRTGVDQDCDGDTRDAAFPDIGADEGNFNGGGITVDSPNGGEQLTVNYQADVRFTLNRPLPIDAYLSLDGGNSWTMMGTIPKDQTHQGMNTMTITTPNVETDRALVKLVSQVNSYEMDSSDAVFSLVRPVITVDAPNGGQRWVASDTNRIVWHSKYIPSAFTVDVDYSTDDGATWMTVADNLSSPNEPASNGYDWIVPNTPSTTALVRVTISGSPMGDTSDAVFTIVEEPSVKVLVPNGGERLIPGHKLTVSFSTVTTDNVNIDYSLDGGATWTEMAHRLPAYVGSYEWTVPQGPTGQGLVRVTNVERPRFSDVFDDYFLILSPELTVLSPNGGVYDLNEPVRVNWSGEDLTTLKLEYSSNNGLTWSTVATGLDATSGTYTFTPPAIPTDAGRVRLTDETVMTNTDMNDLPFHIAQEPSLLLFQPSGGETYVMGSEATVSWESYRIDAVNVEYSTDAGRTWTMIESNTQAIKGALHWTVPHVATTKGEIRVTEAGTNRPLQATSGWFTIVEPKHPMLTVVAPNGGEVYTEGDDVAIRWNARDITGGVTLYYSDDAGATWEKIASNVPATDVGSTGKYMWTAPNAPGDKYMVKVASQAGVSDVSDNTFTVERKLHPELTVIYPNGGESLTGGTDEVIRWSAADIPGNVVVSVSSDDGSTWSDLGSVAAAAAQLPYPVPTDVESDQMLVRVAADDGLTEDVSDGTFSIAQPIVPQIVVTSPTRGTEQWMYGDTVPVEWTSEHVTQVRIDLSIDGGVHWRTLADAVDATTGSWEYEVEDLSPTKLTALLVRVSDADDSTVFDESDDPFTFLPGINAVPGVETGVAGRLEIGVTPNPAVAWTRLHWRQPVSGTAYVRIFDERGHLALGADLGMQASGAHSARLDVGSLPAGTYIYEMTIGRHHVAGRLVIVR